jgi:hypothetical protein
LLDEPPEEVIAAIGLIVQSYGIKAFLRILTAATPQTQAKLLGLMLSALPLAYQEELSMLKQETFCG